MKEILLTNGALTLRVSTLGAEIQSIKDSCGVERIWDGDPKFWKDHAPVLFPIAGGLRDDEYILDGTAYPMPKHGFAKFREFSVERVSDTECVLLLSGEQAKDVGFPFEYEFRVRFALIDNSVRVEYIVTNLDARKIYASVGAHEAYACAGGIENYEVAFDQAEGDHLISTVLAGKLLSHDTIALPLNERNALELKYEYFAVDAQVFMSLKSRAVTLQDHTGKPMIRVSFEGSDYMLLWTKPGAHYICIEPWANTPDFVDWNKDIAQKPGMLALNPGETQLRAHVITVL